MKPLLFKPEEITVGYCRRGDTYTGKLAYVIYKDEKGVLRKEKSWNGWRDNKIEPDVFKNEPTEGFVLNKNVGGYSSGWNHRNSYIRIYDPRGFEFEITLENLLYILEYSNSIKGKGLEGQFVYVWDGKDLILLPCDTPDYQAIENYNKVLRSDLKLTAKNIKLGATYEDDKLTQLVYIGKYPHYENKEYHPYKYDFKIKRTLSQKEKDEETRRLLILDELVSHDKGKQYYFYNPKNESFVNVTSLSKFKTVINEEPVSNLSELQEELLNKKYVYPIVKDSTKKLTKEVLFDLLIKPNLHIILDKNNDRSYDMKSLSLSKDNNRFGELTVYLDRQYVAQKQDYNKFVLLHFNLFSVGKRDYRYSYSREDELLRKEVIKVKLDRNDKDLAKHLTVDSEVFAQFYEEVMKHVTDDVYVQYFKYEGLESVEPFLSKR